MPKARLLNMLDKRVFTKLNKYAYFVIVLMFFCSEVYCQNSNDPLPLGTKFIIKGGNVIVSPEITLSNHDILIDNGVIIKVEKNIKEMYDAQIVVADSLYIYAGFIDGFSHLAMPKYEPKNKEKIADPSTAPFDRIGITPQNTVKSQINISDKDLENARKAGICISLVAPQGLMLPGQVSCVLTGIYKGEDIILKEDIGPFFQFKTTRGAFPATTIGVIAKMKDMIKNASIQNVHDSLYKLGLPGVTRPSFSTELHALIPVASRQKPLISLVQDAKDVSRVLAMGKELGFKTILVTTQNVLDQLEQIKKSESPLFINLNLPEIKKTQKDTDSTKTVTEAEKQFKIAQQNAIKSLQGQPANFEKAGVKFGFNFYDMKYSDIMDNMKIAIDNGLTKKTALASLTSTPAELLSIDHLVGTIEPGKLANLVLMTKPIFEAENHIAYVFVEGQKFYFKKESKKAKETSAKLSTAQVIGQWTYSVETPDGEQKGIIHIDNPDGKISIKITDDSSPDEVLTGQDVEKDNNTISFYVIADFDQPTKVNLTLNFEGDTFKGKANVAGMGTMIITGQKVSQPH